MKNLEIKAKDFFELLKLKGSSMWDVFTLMIDGTQKNLIFLDENNKVIFHYTLPKTLEELKENQAEFSEKFAQLLD